MGLELRRDKKHNLRSKWWYARYTVNGKRRFANLGVEVKGTAPKTLRKQGDMAFECSRTLAAAKLQELLNEAQSRKSATHHLQELYEIKAGEDVRQVELKDIEQVWRNLPQRRKRSALWEKNQCATLRKFREFLQSEYPAVKTLGQVTPRIAEHWLRQLEESGYAAATYNDKLHLVKGLFQKVGIHGGIISNPFAGCPTKIKTTVHHQPFTQEELNKILQHADKIMRPVFLVGMCTAMRQGDCCRLKWGDVDLVEGFISVTTSKTGETAEIPLFPILREEIDKQPRKSEYVFPEVAALYGKKNFGMSWRVKQVLKAAEIETLVERSDGMQKASIKGFHSLRTTWITMALSAGVPMELVRRVTGHSTVDVVLKHYFRPGREAFRDALETAMPKMLTGTPVKEACTGQEDRDQTRSGAGAERRKRSGNSEDGITQPSPKASAYAKATTDKMAGKEDGGQTRSGAGAERRQRSGNSEAGDQKSGKNNEELLRKIRGLLEYGEDLEKAVILRRLAEIEQEMALRLAQDRQNSGLALREPSGLAA